MERRLIAFQADEVVPPLCASSWRGCRGPDSPRGRSRAGHTSAPMLPPHREAVRQGFPVGRRDGDAHGAPIAHVCEGVTPSDPTALPPFKNARLTYI